MSRGKLFGGGDESPLPDGWAERASRRSAGDERIADLAARFRLGALERACLGRLLCGPVGADQDILSDAFLFDSDGLSATCFEGLDTEPGGSALRVALRRLANVGLLVGLDDESDLRHIAGIRLRPSRLLGHAWDSGVVPVDPERFELDDAMVLWRDVLDPDGAVAPVRALLERPDVPEPLLVALRGPAGSGRRHVSRAIATTRGACMLELRRPPTRTEMGEVHFLARWYGSLVRVTKGGDESLLRRLLALDISVVLVLEPEQPVPHAGESAYIEVSLSRPDTRTRQQQWGSVLTGAELGLARRLGRLYQLGYGDIAAVSATAATSRAAGDAGSSDIARLISARLRTRCPPFVHTVEPRAGLSDVVLPDEARDELGQLRDACGSYEGVLDEWGLADRLSKGRGVVALFSGPPGTGKTLAAEGLAAELGRSLLVVNVAAVVSKYVGETAKNIAGLFRNIDPSTSILLFDEADSLFTRRSEGGGANDKYSNMDTNILLQHVEYYDGIVLLTTNLDAALDPALRRRIGYHIRFPEPDAQAREQIYAGLIPDAVPTDGTIVIKALAAEAELAGGHIKNCVLRALHRARADGTPLGQRHLLEALRQECAALGKVIRVR